MGSRRLAVLGVPGLFGGQTLNDYLLSLSPTLYCKFNETSGNLINYGSDGNSATVTGCTQGQTGQLGANEAYLYDGVDDVVTFANAAVPASKALTTVRACFLVNLTSLGELLSGRLFDWNSHNTLLKLSDNNRISYQIDTDGTDAMAVSANNQVDFINSWTLVFSDYDDSNSLGLGRRARIMRATAASATTLLTLATNTAGTGTVLTPTLNLTLGNNQGTVVTCAGLFDMVFMGAGVWSPAGTPADLSIPNRIRQLVFGV